MAEVENSGFREPARTDKRWILYCAVVAGLTFIAFLPALHDGFTSWDDDVYVTNNPSIRDFSFHHVAHQFSSCIGYYQPLTMMSYMADYRFSGLNPRGYHLTSVLFHCINALLVFALIFGLSGNALVAFIAALFFAVHPLRVESVAWISGRKDVIFSFFYLLSLVAFLRYRRNGRRLFFGLSILLFFCSLLSKPMAVTLPLVLLLIEYGIAGKITVRNILGKWSFVAMSLGFSLLTYSTQAHVHASFLRHLYVPSFGILFYSFMTIVPVHLSAYYSLDCVPRSGATFIYPALAICVGIVAFRIARHSRTAIFCLLFFIVTLLPALQIVQIGGYIVADRYSYLPTIGLCYLVAWAIGRFMKNPRVGFALKCAAGGGVGLIVIVSVLLTWGRCLVWKDGITLWSDAIAHWPSTMTYNNRGQAFYEKGDYSRALGDYNEAIRLGQSLPNAWNGRGCVLNSLGDYSQAMSDYKMAVALKPDYADAWYNGGQALQAMNELDRAGEWYDRAIHYQSDYGPAYNGRGIIWCRKGDYNRAIADFNLALAQDAPFIDAYINRGNAWREQGMYGRAIEDYSRAISLDSPNRAIACFGRGIAFRAEGDVEHARRDFTLACALHLDAGCRELERDGQASGPGSR
jgi:Tfp pilus assembly protein PilF